MTRGISLPTKPVRHYVAQCAVVPLKCASLVGVRVRKFHRHVGAELLLLGVGALEDRLEAHRDCQRVVPQAHCVRGESHVRGVVPPEQELAAVRCAGCSMIRRRQAGLTAEERGDPVGDSSDRTARTGDICKRRLCAKCTYHRQAAQVSTSSRWRRLKSRCGSRSSRTCRPSRKLACGCPCQRPDAGRKNLHRYKLNAGPQGPRRIPLDAAHKA